jgi:hypothetical protein
LSKGRPKLDQEIFLDRTHGGRMTVMLRKAGLIIQPISDVYPNNAHKYIPDPEWIRLCGEKNWVIVSGDKRLETVPENREAIIQARVRVFLLHDSNAFPEVWAAAIIIGRYKIQDIVDANPGPFFVTIVKRADSHVSKLRLPYGYARPIPPADTVAPEVLKLTEPEQPEPPKLLTAEASPSNPMLDLFSNLS